MADLVVLAELSIDSSGVVTGVAVAKNALGQLPPPLEDFSRKVKATHDPMDILIKRMFNLRTAAVALLGSFTIGGLLFGLRSFVSDLFASAGASSRFEDHLGKMHTALNVLLVDLLNINPLLEAMTEWIDRINFLLDKVGAGGEKGGKLVAWLFGQTDVGSFLRVVQDIGTLLDKMSGREPVKDFIGPPAPAGIGSEPRFTPDLDKVMEKQKQLRIQQMLLMEGYHDLGGDFEAAFGQGADAVEEMTINEDVLIVKTERLRQVFEDLKESMDPVRLQFDIIMSSVQLFASEIAQAVVKGGVTFRSFASDMLMMVGEMLLAWGALAVITTYFTGYPGFHVAAAAIAAGLGALVAARAFSAESGSRAGGNREAGGGGAAGAGPRTLQVVFAGPTFGFNEATFARYIVEAQRRGERGNG